jgi:hypothetical protein
MPVLTLAGILMTLIHNPDFVPDSGCIRMI